MSATAFTQPFEPWEQPRTGTTCAEDSRKSMEKLSPNSLCPDDVKQKLLRIGGSGKLLAKIDAIKGALGWDFPSADGRIKKLIYKEQRPSGNDIQCIERAYVRCCIDRISKLEAERQAVIAEIERFISYATAADPDFFEADIAQARENLRRLREQSHQVQSVDRQ